ncbi:MAG: topoisomerase DNA-binding C4 zinc finger domain-containing protein, partial [Pseudooceanicola sp.]|nr:topoisomerase DNA-binding C4 zinc finger domain-containing protein [Pseudooceanicola sp.]
KGRLVTAFLINYFQKYVGYDFTASLEDDLDNISAGDADYKAVLSRFWRDFSAAVAETAELRITDVLDKINEVLEPHLFPPTEDGSDPRRCPNCGEGRLSMRTARSGGAFIGCSNYPECRYTRPFGPPGAEGDTITPDGKVLGEDQGDLITLRSGRFGPYVQRGDATEEQPKPPRASLPKGWDADALDLAKALMLLSLPREVGPHPEDGEMIEAAIGRYGPYVKHGRIYANLASADEVFEIGMNRAVEVLAQKAASRGARGAPAQPLRELGAHPEGGTVVVMPGRYGPYVKWEKVNATLPKDATPETVTLETALALIAEKAGSGKKKTAARKAAPKKAAPKKATAKKAAPKKAAPKKAASK